MKTFTFSENSKILLDIIRALSSQLVLIGHTINFLGLLPKGRFVFIKGIPSFSVLIFFLLSGMLISHSVFSKISRGDNYTFPKYFIDRFSRIYTVLIPSILLIVIIDNFKVSLFPHLHLSHFSFQGLLGNLMMLQEFPIILHVKWFLQLPDEFGAASEYWGSALPLWTLPIEWWLYMFFGWIVLVMNKKRNLKKYLVLSVFSIVPFYQLFFGSRMGPGISLYWFLGVLLYILIKQDSTNSDSFCSNKSLRLFLFIQFIIGFILLSFHISILLFAIWMWNEIRHAQSSKLWFGPSVKKVARFFADYSFTLYIIHYSIMLLCCQFTVFNTLTLFVFTIITANVISYFWALLTERNHVLVRMYFYQKLWRE